jgi:hypothetical protein
MEQKPGLFLSLADLALLCAVLKPMEERLGAGERSVLSRMEQELYKHMSVGEAAKLLAGDPGSHRRGTR